MRTLKFTKMQGAGNDFVMLDGIRQDIEPTPALIRYLADRRFGIVHDAIDLFIFLGHTGECEDAGEHDRAADEPCDDAERHITVCDLEDRLCLEENAGTDDNANNHANCGEKAVFAFQFVIHENTSFLKPEMSGANTKRRGINEPPPGGGRETGRRENDHQSFDIMCNGNSSLGVRNLSGGIIS